MEILIETRRGTKLNAKLERSHDSHSYTIFAHCFTCTKDLKATKRIVEMLVAHGFAVLRFDFTGLGRSEGNFSETTFETNLHDLEDVIAWMRDNNMPPRLLIGHSLGGAAVLNYASRDDHIDAVATYGAPSRPEHVVRQFEYAIDHILEEGEAIVDLAGRQFTIQKEFIEAVERVSKEHRHKNITIPALIMHAPEDETVSFDNASTLRNEIGDTASLIRIEQADHLLTKEHDARYVGEVIARWAQRALQINLPKEDKKTIDKSALPDISTVSVEGYKFRTMLRAGEHIIYADEPQKVGGDDTGMAPFELLQAALGACTSMTLRMYAERKGWELGEIKVDLVGEWVQPKESECHQDETNRMYQIQRAIQVAASLSEEQRTKLEEIANKCPVHKALHQPVETLTYVEKS